MHKTRHAATILVAMLILPTINVLATGPSMPLVGDGTTPTVTPQGTLIVPPPGAPLQIRTEDPAAVTFAADAWSWGPIDLLTAENFASPGRSDGGGDGVSALSCTRYITGWYETNAASVYGGHMGINPQNMPPDSSYYCSGTGMGYTDGVSFSSNSWIQAGLAIFPGETSAKWFCQSNDNGNYDTRYGTANSYGNGATVYTWFSRDSNGVWRTYRYDGGQYSIELGCTISRGAGGNVQTFGEIQGATSTSAPMGPWKMFDLRYQATSGTWYAPTQLQAYYPGGTPCPPYGAGTVSSGYLEVGTGKACTTGTSAYPN